MRELPLAGHTDFSALPERQQDNPLWVSQLIVQQDQSLRPELHRQVAARLLAREAEADLSAAMLALARTPNRLSLILTLNYDLLVETAAEAIGRSCVTLGTRDIQQLLNDDLAEPSTTLRVLHIHGSLRDDPEELVLDAHAYSQRAEDQSVEMLFAAVLPYYNLCILGCSFEEQYLATVMQARRPRKPRHVIVGDEAVADRILAGDSALSTVEHNILVCDYPGAEHGVLDGFCRRLVRCPPLSRAAVAMVAVPDLEPDPVYQPRRFLDLSEDGRREDSSLEISLALGQLKPLGEDAVRAEPHAIVVGPPGAGKSRLLQRLAEHPAEGERAVLIRLRDIRETVGVPSTLLEAWLSAGTVLDGGGPIPVQAISDGEVRAHILLDGLDELPREQRSLVAEATARIGRAFPEQRFTLSSRPAGELELLPDDWRALELLCDGEWRTGLLDKLGSSETELVSRLGAIYPLIEPLLRVPFFLRGLLELEGTPEDGLDLALGLLQRLAGQDPQLRTIGLRLQQWLQRVALTMALDGSTTVTIEQLRQLASEMDVGDADRVVDLLASRSLLLEASGRYSFQHRLFGEALVAEFLLGEDPARWLDVLTPEVAGRSALREDWRGVVDLLLPRSRGWREAVAARDPRTAARATPTAATREERQAAASLLWERAQQLDVWIDPGGPPSSRSDGEVVAELIRGGDLPGLEEEIREALHADTRFRRGNAVDVMAAAEMEGVEEALRQVLLEDPDAVVRRSAAVAARRGRINGLRDLLQQRALEAADQAEAEELASAVLELSPPEQRLERAQALLSGGSHGVNDFDVVSDLDPESQLRWISLRVREGGGDHWLARRQLDTVVSELDEPSEQQAALVGFVAAATASTSTEVAEFLGRHPAGAGGLLEALREGLAENYRINHLLAAVGPEGLRENGADPELIDEALAWQERIEQPAPQRSGETGGAGNEPASLEQILAQGDPEQQAILLARGLERYATAARSASTDLLQRLVALLDRLWGENDLREVIERDGNQTTMPQWAAVVLSLGPAAGMPLEQARWVQAALCRWLFLPQISWLREEADDGWLFAALGELRATDSLGDLAEIAGTDEELEAIVEALIEVDASALSARARERAIESLSRARRADLMQRLSSSDDLFAELALPRLARSGDAAAQRAQLEATIDALESGAYFDRHDLDWLKAAEDPLLFDLLARAIPLAARRERTGHPEIHSVLGPLQAAAERVDPIAALDLYDRLIVEKPWFGAQFMFENRDSLLQRLLSESGARFTAEAAARLSLPSGPA